MRASWIIAGALAALPWTAAAQTRPDQKAFFDL